jgi:hypothetical protein
MRAVARRSPTLFDVARHRVGYRGAIHALSFMVQWDIARRSLHGTEALTLTEYQEWWRMSRATAFREQARFRAAFPGESTPDRLLDAIAAYWDQRRGVKALGAVSLDAAQLAL